MNGAVVVVMAIGSSNIFYWQVIGTAQSSGSVDAGRNRRSRCGPCERSPKLSGRAVTRMRRAGRGSRPLSPIVRTYR